MRKVAIFVLIALPSLLAQVTGNRRCFLCHGKKDFGVMRKGKFYSLYIDSLKFGQSVHRKFTCVSCHRDVTTIPHLRKPEEIHCLQCHYEGNVVGAPVSAMPEKYKESVHGKAIKKGNPKAPDCKNCHTTHYVRKDTDTLSTIYKENVPKTCGRCHIEVYEEYITSIHGESLRNGVIYSATCSDCHREHDILPQKNPRSSLNPQNVIHTCGKCHGDVQIMKRVGVPVKQVSAYKESFHGIALEYGEVKAANCTSCHGYHSILPSRDPNSPIHPDNLAKTCGKCHPNANENVAKGKYHIIPGEREAGIVYYVYTFFKWFTILILIGLAIHIALDIAGRIRMKIKGE